MTQEQLATAAGIGRVTLVRIENADQSTEIRDPGGAGWGARASGGLSCGRRACYLKVIAAYQLAFA